MEVGTYLLRMLMLKETWSSSSGEENWASNRAKISHLSQPILCRSEREETRMISCTTLNIELSKRHNRNEYRQEKKQRASWRHGCASFRADHTRA
jgi:hypothetical protein